VAAPIAVRLVEGTAHGLLLVRSISGEILGHGDFLQVVHPDRIESRLVLRFKDGSLHDENVAFSQQGVFTMLRYRLVQRGPSFPETLDAVLDRKTRSYKVQSTRQGKEETLTGSIELPRMCTTACHRCSSRTSDQVPPRPFTSWRSRRSRG